MSGARSFEDLWIWQTARGLVKDVDSGRLKQLGAGIEALRTHLRG